MRLTGIEIEIGVTRGDRRRGIPKGAWAESVRGLQPATAIGRNPLVSVSTCDLNFLFVFIVCLVPSSGAIPCPDHWPLKVGRSANFPDLVFCSSFPNLEPYGASCSDLLSSLLGASEPPLAANVWQRPAMLGQRDLERASRITGAKLKVILPALPRCSSKPARRRLSRSIFSKAAALTSAATSPHHRVSLHRRVRGVRPPLARCDASSPRQSVTIWQSALPRRLGSPHLALSCRSRPCGTRLPAQMSQWSPAQLDASRLALVPIDISPQWPLEPRRQAPRFPLEKKSDSQLNSHLVAF